MCSTAPSNMDRHKKKREDFVLVDSNGQPSDISELKNEIVKLKLQIYDYKQWKKSFDKITRKFFILFMAELVFLAPLAVVFFHKYRRTFPSNFEKRNSPRPRDVEAAYKFLSSDLPLSMFWLSLGLTASMGLSLYFRIPKKPDSFDPNLLRKIIFVRRTRWDFFNILPKPLGDILRLSHFILVEIFFSLEVAVGILSGINLLSIFYPWFSNKTNLGNIQPCPKITEDLLCCRAITGEDSTKSPEALCELFATVFLNMLASLYFIGILLHDDSNFEKKLKFLHVSAHRNCKIMSETREQENKKIT